MTRDKGQHSRYCFRGEGFRHFKATDPRDKVYPFSAFATDIKTRELLPDYKLPLTEVYRGVVKFCTEKHPSLEILGYCITQEAQAALPSRIPDRHIEMTRFTTRYPFYKISI